MKKFIGMFLLVILLFVGCFNEKEEKKETVKADNSWPNIYNTGIPLNTPVLTTFSATIRTTKAGQVFDAIELKARLYVEHPNVVIRRSRLIGDDYYSVYCTTSGTSLTIEDSEIIRGAHITDGFTAKRNHIHAGYGKTASDGFVLSASNVLIEDNLIDGLIGAPGAHLDGIQVMGGDNITIRHNWIEAVSPEIINGGVNAALFFEPDFGEITNIVIDNNMLIEKDGYYPLRVNARGKVEITNNRFRKGHLGGPYRIISSVITKWENNAYEDGEVISAPAQVKLTTKVAINSINSLNTVDVGKIITCSAIATYSDGTTEIRDFTWSISNTNAARITADGVLTTVSTGTAIISALKNGIMGKMTIQIGNLK